MNVSQASWSYHTNTRHKGVRRYATEPAPQSKINPVFLGIGGAAGLAAGAYYYYYTTTTASPTPILNLIKEPQASGRKTFQGGDQGFIDLKLEKVDVVNTNTKRFRFALSEEGDVSGLKVASAILTKYKGLEDEKATIRPYTPVSDEGEASPFFYFSQAY